MSTPEAIGRLVLYAGIALLVLGLVLVLMGRTGWMPRGLPGDVVIRRPGVVVYFPFATMLVLSILGTLVLWLIQWLRR